MLDLSRLNLLIVDDDEHMRRLLRLVLHGLGAGDAREAGNGDEAIREIGVRMPDIIFVDWVMGPVDGIELTRWLRTSPDCRNTFVPVIMVTAHADRERVLEARDVGVTEFLVKPFSAIGVYSRLRAVIEKPRRFVRTKHYYGPDRRRKEAPAFQGPDRRGADGELPPLPPMDAQLTQEQVNQFYFTREGKDGEPIDGTESDSPVAGDDPGAAVD